ncbi:hypothetical protein B484DRAFT_443014 [Ochromonadaceae sp. CCMP2298]|nr:hypothetical protein B484DRAFT_443014 [Ochromonadaceae sp. CCMP2298]
MTPSVTTQLQSCICTSIYIRTIEYYAYTMLLPLLPFRFSPNTMILPSSSASASTTSVCV